ncbi:MAG TPA: UbiA-like polyprenyltransferase [Gemmatimonadaceae bacterium]|jgi:4-hydroxybenzoate polyprenyltransferase|nr:UbiA-like polyprenyltransferase [Gemmatimonadaceae bacterium]
MSTREGQTFIGASRIVRYANFVKLPHTVFALPFALVGVVLASYLHNITVRQVAWIVLAFTSARFAAMGFNRIVDRHIDARNPRTSMREIPSGMLGVGEASASVAVASFIFLCSAHALNTICFLLSPIALAWVFFYSYTKRFTHFSHLVLGLGLSIAPVGGYLAITGTWSTPWWMLCALSLAVMTWSAGFDILYALQDIAFDRANNLRSIPVALGEPRALLVARLLHVISISALITVGIAVHSGILYSIGVTIAALLLLYEHTLVKPGDLSRLNAAFFTMNGIISIVYFGFVLAERVTK